MSSTSSTRDDPDQVETSDHAPLRQRPITTEPLGYVVPLDGLRALAVIAVVLYHGRFSWIPGGFLGVSAFFTLSGFLITSLILREWATKSTLDLRSFWTRRFRRLLPASWVTMGLILAMGAFGAWNDDQLRAVRSDLPFSLLEVVNWHFIAVDRSYSAEFAAPSPFAHFWSLAVEQQFYILLPLLAVGVLTLGRSVVPRRRLGRLVAVFVALSIYSLVANGLLARTSIDRAYYGTDTRMAEMLIGSLLACFTLRRLRLPAGRARTLALALGALAMAVTLWLWHAATLQSEWLYPWGLLLTASCTAAIIFAAVQGGLIARALGAGPLVWIGRISYGIYLLHWPIFLWLSPARIGWSVWPLFALRMTVTIAAALVLYRLVENPVRRGERIRSRSGWWLALIAAVALIAGDLWVTRDLGETSSLSLASVTADTTATTIPPPPVRVLLVGDELATSTAAALQGVDGLEVSASAAPSCGLALGGWIRLANGDIERDVDRCRSTRDQWLDAATTSRPDIVLLMTSARDVSDRRMSTAGAWGGPQDGEQADFLRTDLGSLVDSFQEDSDIEVGLVTLPYMANTTSPTGTPLVIPPNAGAEAPALAQAEALSIAQGAPAPGFAENDRARVDLLNAGVADVAASRGVRLFDLGSRTSSWPGGGLDPKLRTDGVGFTAEGGELIGTWLLPLLRDSAPPPTPAPSTAAIAAEAPLHPAPQVVPRRVVTSGDRLDVLVVGDSVARNLAYGLQEWVDITGTDAVVTSAGQLGCPIARGGSFRFKRDTGTFAAECEWSTTFPELVSGFRPDVAVVASGIWEVSDRRLPGDDRFRHIGDPLVDRYLLGEFLTAIDTLGADGATVVLTTQPRIDPGLDQGFQDLPEGDPQRIERFNELLNEAAALRPGVARVVDLRTWLAGQPGGETDPGKRPDGVHFTDEYVGTVGGWLGPQLATIAAGA